MELHISAEELLNVAADTYPIFVTKVFKGYSTKGISFTKKLALDELWDVMGGMPDNPAIVLMVLPDSSVELKRCNMALYGVYTDSSVYTKLAELSNTLSWQDGTFREIWDIYTTMREENGDPIAHVRDKGVSRLAHDTILLARSVPTATSGKLLEQFFCTPD